MKGTSKVIMGATLVMVASLAIVLGLVLVLLAELYCSLLPRRRRLQKTTSTSSTAGVTTMPEGTTVTPMTSSQPQDQPPSSPLSNFYAQGVLRAPRSFLFPSDPLKDDKIEAKDQKTEALHQVLEIKSPDINTSPRQIGIISTSSPSQSLITSPPRAEIFNQDPQKRCSVGEHFVYISNPIYDNDARPSMGGTPFETPDSSPSRLGNGGSSGEEQEEEMVVQSCLDSLHLLPTTPPLTPMKQLPAEACSVSLRNGSSLNTSGSDSNSNNGLSSSSSVSPCTSPSW